MINANEFGQALFALTREQEQDSAVLEEIDAVQAIFADQPDYVRLLDTPSIPKEERLSLLREAFSGLSPYHLNFLSILCEKHAVSQYPACAKVYHDLYDQSHNILRATAITAVPMTEAQQSALLGKLQAMTGKQVVLSNTVDPQKLGGVTLRFGGVQLDGSLQSRLQELRQSLAGVIV